jgi:hypothetical protein
VSFAVAAVLALVAGVVALGSPSRPVQAQPTGADLEPGVLQVWKTCDPDDAVATFDVELDVQFEGAPPDFNFDFTIDCGEIVRIFDGPGSEVDVSALFDALEANPDVNVIVTVEEVDIAPWWEVEYFAVNFEHPTPGSGSPDPCETFSFDAGDVLASFNASGAICEIVNSFDNTDLSNLAIVKSYNGAGTAEFSFSVATSECLVEVDGQPIVQVPAGGTFTIAVTPPATTGALLFCDGPATITELPSESSTLVEPVTCSSDEVTVAGASVTFPFPETPLAVDCEFENAVADDDPALANISVTKVCVGEGFEATFAITVASVTVDDVACDDAVTAVDLEPGDYGVSETIGGADAEAFSTVIVCGDAAVVGTETTVTIPAEDATDVACVIINTFDPEGDADADGDGIPDILEALLCGCRSLDIEIDIDNTNGNTIGIENDNANSNANANDNDNLNGNANENKNDNQNENTQDQTNTQDQGNSNEQTNNITSSPEVNIDFE